MTAPIFIEQRGLAGLGSAPLAPPPVLPPVGELPAVVRPLAFGGLALALTGAGLLLKKKRKLGATVTLAGLATSGIGAFMWKRHGDAVAALQAATAPKQYAVPYGGIINDYLQPSVPADQYNWTKGAR